MKKLERLNKFVKVSNTFIIFKFPRSVIKRPGQTGANP
jgi:hypothetical protein